jgi:hypothetical protein
MEIVYFKGLYTATKQFVIVIIMPPCSKSFLWLWVGRQGVIGCQKHFVFMKQSRATALL